MRLVESDRPGRMKESSCLYVQTSDQQLIPLTPCHVLRHYYTVYMYRLLGQMKYIPDYLLYSLLCVQGTLLREGLMVHAK